MSKIQIQFTDGRNIESLVLDAAKHDADDAAFQARVMRKRGFVPVASSVEMFGAPADAQARHPLGFAASALFTRKRTGMILRAR